MRIFSVLMMIAFLVGCRGPVTDTTGDGLDLPVYKGAWLGFTPPGMTPVEFATEIYGPGRAINSVFSPDGTELFFTTDINGNGEADIVQMRLVDGTWSPPEPLSFNSLHTDNDLCISHDGQRVFWRSWRPLPGQSQPQERSYIWFADRSTGGWGEPQPLQCGGEHLLAGYPAVTADGTLFFPHRSESNVGESDIHVSRLVDGVYSKPENLGAEVNTKYIEGDMCVAADGSFLVVAGWERPDNVGGGSSDLYISFRGDDGTWSQQINLGPLINTEVSENCPTLSPDGRYFFFIRYDGDHAGTYWVDSAVLAELRPDG
jgi:hypothetical protein